MASLLKELLCLAMLVYSAYTQGSPMLYFTDGIRNNIFKMLASGGSQIPMGGRQKIYNPVAIANDPVRQYIYWTDRAISDHLSDSVEKGIGRLSLTTNKTDFIYLPVDSIPDGLAVDYTTGLLYLTDTGNDVIKVINFEEKTSTTLLRTGLDQPRAIVLDPEDGWMYWSDWGSSPRIEKAKMDGTTRQTLVEFIGLRWPNGLALDKQAGRLYFCEALTPVSVQSVQLDGKDRIIHFVNSVTDFRFFGIAVDDHYVYLTSWLYSTILRMNKTAVGSQTLRAIGVASLGTTRLNGLVLTGSSYQRQGSNACTLNNGGCSHFCLPVPGGRTCSCPDDMQLNGQQCQITSTNSPIRLAGGTSEKQGRVEVNQNGFWGTVCDTMWDAKDAKAVCNILKISGPSKAVSGAKFGPGSGPIHLNKVDCSGNEMSLFDCMYETGIGSCGHNQDAGVICGINCARADVIFIVDSSRNIDSRSWNLVIKFLKDLAWSMSKQITDLRLGAVSFSDSASVVTALNSYRNISDFITLLQAVPYAGRGSNIAHGLDRAYDLYRLDPLPATARTAILLAGGLADINTGMERSVAITMRRSLIKIAAVGVGSSSVSTNIQLLSITGTQNEVFTTSNYESLTNFVEPITNLACEVTTATQLSNSTISTSSSTLTPPTVALSSGTTTASLTGTPSLTNKVLMKTVPSQGPNETVTSTPKYTNNGEIGYKYALLSLLAVPVIIGVMLIAVCFGRKRNSNTEEDTEPYDDIVLDATSESTTVTECDSNAYDNYYHLQVDRGQQEPIPSPTYTNLQFPNSPGNGQHPN